MKISKQNKLPTSFKGYILPNCFYEKPTSISCYHAICKGIECNDCVLSHKNGFTEEEEKELLSILIRTYNENK